MTRISEQERAAGSQKGTTSNDYAEGGKGQVTLPDLQIKSPAGILGTKALATDESFMSAGGRSSRNSKKSRFFT